MTLWSQTEVRWLYTPQTIVEKLFSPRKPAQLEQNPVLQALSLNGTLTKVQQASNSRFDVWHINLILFCHG